MLITLTDINLVTVPEINQVVNIYWKYDQDPDSSYTQIGDATVNPSGVIISPNPYQFTTGNDSLDVRVKAVNTCNGNIVTALFDGIELPIWVEYQYVCEQDTPFGLVNTYTG